MNAKDRAVCTLVGVLAFSAGILVSASIASRSEDQKDIQGKKFSLTLDLGYSDNRFTRSPPDTWWQPDQNHEGHVKAGGGTVGLSWDVTDSLTLGAHYVQLGRTEVNALAIAFPGDDRAKQGSIDPMRAPCSDSFKDGCLYHWHTTAFSRGINLSASYKLFEIAGVRLDGKVGLYANRLTAHAVVEPVGCNDSCGWRVQVDQSVDRITPMWGAAVRWKWFAVGLEFYEGIGGGTPIAYNRGQPIVANVQGRVEVKTISVRIPFSL